MAAAFDTLKYFEELKSAGVPDSPAKVQASAFREFASGHREQNLRDLATKADLRELEMRLDKKIDGCYNQIESSKHEILKWVIATILAQTAIIAAMTGVVIAILLK